MCLTMPHLQTPPVKYRPSSQSASLDRPRHSLLLPLARSGSPSLGPFQVPPLLPAHLHPLDRSQEVEVLLEWTWTSRPGPYPTPAICTSNCYLLHFSILIHKWLKSETLIAMKTYTVDAADAWMCLHNKTTSTQPYISLPTQAYTDLQPRAAETGI